MKWLKSFTTHSPQAGFTLVELIVVFSITTVLASIGFASFVTYSRQQTLNTAVADAKLLLQTARSETLAQVNAPSYCYGGGQGCQCQANQPFGGYEVNFCCASGTSSQMCATTNCLNNADKAEHYELAIVCGGNRYLVDSKDYPVQVTTSQNNAATTVRRFLFVPLTGLVDGLTAGTGSVTLIMSQFNLSKAISVSSTGVIQ